MFENVSLKNKKILITAGASGLGLTMAQAFLNAGATVMVCDVDNNVLDAVKKDSPNLITAVCDVSDESQVTDMFNTVKSELGGLDVLINNAGIAGPTGFVETLSKQDWDRTFAINITGQFLCVKAAVPLLKESEAGSIINLSSAAGHLGFKGRSAYSSSKWAVIGFTKTLAIELGRFGIRVNAILPGAVEGERINQVIASKAKTLGKPFEEVHKDYVNNAALGRMATAQDIANMALFTASDAARSVTGQSLVVDGHTQVLA